MSNIFNYTRLTPEEQGKRGILGRLVGVIADFKDPTRNGRLYSEATWDEALADEIFQEKIQRRCCLGELGHPANRDEVEIEKAAICLAEMPKKGNDGKIYGVFDILNTPCGQILKTLCDYGTEIGVSTRGNGDTQEDYNGQESVVPGTYQLECWDAVLIPAVKSARPKYVTESLKTKKKVTLTESLNKVIESSTKDKQAVMRACLEDLNIKIDSDDLDDEIEIKIPDNASSEDDIKVELENEEKEESEESKEGETSEDQNETDIASEDEEESDEIKDEEENEDESVDDVKESLVKDLKEALNEKQSYKLKVEALNNSLSVSYTKETELKEENTQLKESIAKLVEENKQIKGMRARAKKFEDDGKKLSESFDRVNSLLTIEHLTNQNLNRATSKNESIIANTNKRLVEALNKLEESKQLNESLQGQLERANKDKLILKEAYDRETKKVEEQTQLNIAAYKRVKSLKESLQSAAENSSKKDNDLKQIDTYRNKLTESIKETAEYKNKAEQFAEAYAKTICGRYGIEFSTIEDKIKDSNPEEIKSLCESVSTNSIRMKALPFATREKITGIKYTAPQTKEEREEAMDSAIDEDLERLFNNFNDPRH